MPAISEDRVDFSHAKWSAWVSAGLTVLSTIFLIIIVATPALNGTDLCSASTFRQVVANFGDNSHSECLVEYFDASRDRLGLAIAFGIADALAAVLVVPVAMSLGDLFGQNRYEIRFAVPFIMLSSVVSATQLLHDIGRSTVTDWLSSSSWGLPDDGLRVLVISSIVSGGAGTWIFALDDLLFGLALIFFSVAAYKNENVVPRWFAHLGSVAGGLACLNFILELARFGNWQTVSIVEGVSQGIVGLLLFPAWLIWLGLHFNTVVVGTGHAALSDEPGL